MYSKETIAAISTGMSNSGIGIVRISGEEAFQVIDKIYKGKEVLSKVQSHTIHYGYIVDGKETIDEVLVSIMRAPRTFTGEDTVEINCHGGVYVVKRVLDIGICEDIIDCYDRAQKIALEEKVGYQQVLAGLANTILSLALYHNINVGLENDKNTHLMQEACKIVRENYLTGITSQEVAKLIKMGYPSFRKMFKEYTNISPAHYLMELKLQTARVLLMNSNRSVKDIASYLHYKDSLYFSALFRKYMGVSPFAYRKMCNNLRNDFDISI